MYRIVAPFLSSWPSIIRRPRSPAMMILSRRFLRICREALFQPKVADSSGSDLSGGQLLMRTLIVKRLLERSVLASDEKHVGILLPPSVAAVLANASVTLMRRVPVNLNYTLPAATINACIAQAGVRHVLTSRLFVSKLELDIDANLVFLEDFPKQVQWYDYVVAAIQAYAVPASMLDRLFGMLEVLPSNLMAIIFTSGTTGNPKGVLLSYDNIGSNIDAADTLFQIRSNDAVLGILPFFHSFGFTGGLWLVLALPTRGVYHFSPLDAGVIGKLCERQRVTIMLAAPTFLRMYLRRCQPEQFKALDMVVLGAEKMPPGLAQAFQEKFGTRPFEAYGTTELSPMAAINVPARRSTAGSAAGVKEGTVGRAIPGTRARIVDPDSNVELEADKPGMLLIQGPNVMLGYLNQPEKTAEVIRDGWYITGDIARIDGEGFITIVDRANRFSKIGGEMVPHLKIEECLQQILSDESPNDEEMQAVVTAIPHPSQGERLVVLHKATNLPVDEILTRMVAKGLPTLWMPSRDSFVAVPQIPILGSGKVDLKRVKEIANAEFGKAVE